MKTFRTVGSGSTQTIEPIENNKIPVYETKTAAENDLANLEVGQIIATKDEGNELSNPVDVVQDGNMHAVTSNAVADAISYSTNEVKTGGKWIDGKPIYKKTLVFTNITLTTGTPTQIGTTDIPIGNIIKTEDFVLKSGLATVGSSNKSVYIEYNGKIFARQDLSSYADGWYIYFTIEYTKATD